MTATIEQVLVEAMALPGEKLGEKTKMSLVKAARILVEAKITDEKKILDAYQLLAEMQRKGELEYPVDYKFTEKALKLASIIANKASSTST